MCSDSLTKRQKIAERQVQSYEPRPWVQRNNNTRHWWNHLGPSVIIVLSAKLILSLGRTILFPITETSEKGNVNKDEKLIFYKRKWRFASREITHWPFSSRLLCSSVGEEKRQIKQRVVTKESTFRLIRSNEAIQPDLLRYNERFLL